MADFEGLYAIRDGIPEDHALIYATLLRGVYYGDSWFSFIPKNIFMDNYKVFVGTLLASSKVAIKIACLPEQQDVIIGYSIISHDYNTIHYVYVKAAWRQSGVARSLLPKFPVAVTHLTKLGKQLLISKFPNAVFNPFAY
jgi:hypothetical protein